MKINKFFNKNKLIKTSIISLILSVFFFLTAILYIGNSDYRLSHYSKEIEETFGVKFNEAFNFNYIFASSNEGFNRSISLNNIDKLIIKAPNTDIWLYESSEQDSYIYENNTLDINISIHKLNKIDDNKFFSYQYLEKTKTGVLTLNDSIEGIFSSQLHLNVPSKFKNKILLETFEENVNNYSHSLNISINQPK